MDAIDALQRYCTIPAAAKEFEVSDSWLRLLVQQGRLRVGQVGGVKLLVRDEVRAALADAHSRYRPPVRMRVAA